MADSSVVEIRVTLILQHSSCN